jgi:menaquinone-dependent protoporphyrinogen oxidase
MAKIGFVYSTVDGHTLEICQRLIEVVERGGFEAEVLELTADSALDLAPYDQVVIGASVRYGKHRPELTRFINEHTGILESKLGAFFSVNAVARKAEKKQPHSNPYVRKFLKTIVWKPTIIGIFGGRIHYAKYRFWDRTMIRFIMWMTKGPTDLNANVDFTDWDEVEAFGLAICELLQQER